jgi:hypothetical protein
MESEFAKVCYADKADAQQQQERIL